MSFVYGIKKNATRVTKDSRGVVVQDVYLVAEASTWLEAMYPTPGTYSMPDIGDDYAGATDLKCISLEPQAVPNSDRIWEVNVTWGPSSGNIPPPSRQDVEWNFGTGSEKIDLSIDGYVIGQRNFQVSNLVRDEDAQIGCDVLVPSLEIDVRMPLPWQWNPLTIADWIGCCNAANMTIDGTAFAPRTVLLVAASAHRVLPEPATTAHEVKYKFVAGFKKLPTGVPKIRDTGAPWTQTTLPIAYGYWPRMRGLRADGSYALCHEELVKREPFDLVVFRAYDDRPLQNLGIT